MKARTFWLILALVGIIIVGATIGGAVGGTASTRHSNEENNSGIATTRYSDFLYIFIGLILFKHCQFKKSFEPIQPNPANQHLVVIPSSHYSSNCIIDSIGVISCLSNSNNRLPFFQHHNVSIYFPQWLEWGCTFWGSSWHEISKV
jgi:hypothetical protein